MANRDQAGYLHISPRNPETLKNGDSRWIKRISSVFTHMAEKEIQGKMLKTVQVAPVDEISSGESKSVEVGAKLIGVFNVDGKFYAIDGKCTHTGASMVDGWLDGKELTCPFHGARFDVTTGKVLSPPARCDVGTYPVHVEDGVVVVKVET